MTSPSDLARLDDLVNSVKDTELKRELQDAVADFKKRQRFGLVFEEHIPETTAVLGLPVRVGSIVTKRKDSDGDTLWKVSTLSNGGKTAAIESIENNTKESMRTADLIAVKRIGDAIYPVITPIGRIQKDETKPFHAVIEGENYHALQLLKYLCAGKVDCIYIDPPYNSGARDWKYNNRYVDATDVWRHSKWLSFMQKRLRLSKVLLKRDGVLIVTIDENEVHHLGMLLEKVFPDYLRYMVTIVSNPKGTGKANFSRVDEYAFFIVPDVGHDVIQRRPGRETLEEVLPASEFDEDIDEQAEPEEENDEAEDSDEPDLEALPEDDAWEYRHARRRGAESSYRRQRPNQFYPILIDEKAKKVIRAEKAIPLDAKPSFAKVDGLRPIWPIDATSRDRVWGFVPESMQERIDQGNVLLGKHNTKRDTWTINYRVPRKPIIRLKTVWRLKAYDAGTHGTEMLRKVLGEPGLFPFPKSVYAVRDCLAAVVRNRKDALILDFFAGSGTTLHATCLLNAEDQGKRRTIMVTNNELSGADARRVNKMGFFRGDPEFEKEGIFERVTKPRCEAIISGHRPNGEPIPGKHLNKDGKARGRAFSLGFDENVEFSRIEYADPDEIELGRGFDKLSPALWLSSGSMGARKSPSTIPDFIITESSGYAILFKESKFEKFRELLSERPDITHVWVVTDSEEAYMEMCSDLPPGILTSMLYRDYIRNFQDIRSRGA